MKNKIEQLRALKNDNDFSIITDQIIHTLLDATIELLEREQPKQEPQKDKWQPLKDGWGNAYWGASAVFLTDWNTTYVDYGMVCKNEHDLTEKYKLLRAVSRLDSFIREYGEFVPKEQANHNYRVDIDSFGSWTVFCDFYISPLTTYHNQDVMQDVCNRLNNGEIEL